MVHIPKFFFDAARDVNELSESFFKEYGLNYFQYSRNYKDGSHFFLLNRPDFVQARLKANRGVKSSIKGEQIDKQNYLFLWNENLPEVDTDMARDHDLDNGICFVQRHADYYNLIAFAAPCREKNALNTYLENLDALQNFISDFSDRAQNLITKAHDQRMVLPTHLQDENQHQLFWDARRKIKMRHLDLECELSYREFQCMKLVASGDTMDEMASKLEVSPRTIETYLNRVKSKLGVFKKSDLAKIFMKQFPGVF